MVNPNCEYKHKNSNMLVNAEVFAPMVGSKIKHNTNLFSCTYFSGIHTKSDLIQLGYGVNDVAFGFSRHKFRELMDCRYLFQK